MLSGQNLVSIDQPLRCMFCGLTNGNHLGYCVIVDDITGYNVLPRYATEDEDFAPEAEQNPATD